MTWQWVVLILGIVLIIALLLAYMTWSTMKVQMFKAISRTIPDTMQSSKRPEEQDTLVETRWPEGYTGSEDVTPN